MTYFAVGLTPKKPDEVPKERAFPGCVELAPASDAVNVSGDNGRRNLAELFPRPAHLALDFAEHRQAPGLEIDLRDGAVVQDGELLGKRLTWWQTASLLHLTFLIAPVHEVAQHGESLRVSAGMSRAKIAQMPVSFQRTRPVQDSSRPSCPPPSRSMAMIF